jgi:predicted nucleic acid-binding Zn ribbon protein
MQETLIIQKECLACGKVLHGRSDKKFCNDYCRNAYNNSLKAVTTTVVRNINNALLKNRRILEAVLGEEEMQKVPKDKLLQQGFQFRYHTHTYANKKGNVYVFCYEFGYLPLEHDWYLVVKRNEKPGV